MSRVDKPREYRARILSSKPWKRRWPFLTICGSKLPLRSRGVRTSTGPCSVASLVGETVANRVRDLERLTAGRLLRSPSGLAPQPAGAIDQIGVGLRRHDAPFSSCLHRASDTSPYRPVRAEAGAE